jgi:hypothetical protein
MKITKYRLQKIINKNGKQTRKKFKGNKKILTHTNTVRNKRPFNLLNRSIKNWNTLL